ncbi:hypothetical protein CBR_g54780 [Chara braunii]|uniref:Uncharacterized protein n=1 Tax=Chara braunii TaxID=69332 RepID=A0A388MCF1_CHABU|nr:hypothetical protein CBR_g54780 [Chara braunii]|eukprot:GBG92237.1 hypothetical protein CBR_g54780 [Chara braunii]
MRQWEAFATPGSRPVEGVSPERGEADELSMPDGPSMGRRASPMGEPTDAISMPGQCPGDFVHDKEGPSLAEGGDAEVAGRVEADWRVNRAALGQLVCWCPNWRQRKQPPFAWSKGHLGFVGEGGCKVFVAYSFDAGDERKVGNDGVGEVVAEGADVLDEAVHGTGLAEVAELFKVVVNGFLGVEGGSEEVGLLEEGVTWCFGGSAVANFSHPPFGCIVEEAGGGNGEPVGKGHMVEVKRVMKLGGRSGGGRRGGVAGGGCGGGSGLRCGGGSGFRGGDDRDGGDGPFDRGDTVAYGRHVGFYVVERGGDGGSEGVECVEDGGEVGGGGVCWWLFACEVAGDAIDCVGVDVRHVDRGCGHVGGRGGGGRGLNGCGGCNSGGVDGTLGVLGSAWWHVEMGGDNPL